MNNQITIELPLPANALRPNGRAHWAVKMKAVKKARTLARAQLGAAIDTRRDMFGYDDECKPVGYSITWYYWRGVGPDTDNALASCKAYLDGCCDVLGVNDRELQCREVVRIKESGEARVRITFFFGGRPAAAPAELDNAGESAAARSASSGVTSKIGGEA